MTNYWPGTVLEGCCNHKRIEIGYGEHLICRRMHTWTCFVSFEYFLLPKLGGSKIKVCKCFIGHAIVIAGVEDASELLWMLFEFIRQGRCIICPWVNGHNSPSCNVWKIIDDPVRCQTSPTPCLFPAFPKSSSHKRRLIDMRVILQNTTNISRRPVDASIPKIASPYQPLRMPESMIFPTK